MTQQKRPNEWCQVSSATQWIGTPTALAIVGGTCSELEAKDKIILAIQTDLVRMSSPLIIHEGDVGEPYPNVTFWMNDTFFHRFEGQRETCWVKVLDEKLIQLPKGALAINKGWRVDYDRISWPRGDFLALRPELSKRSRLQVQPKKGPSRSLPIASTKPPMIRRYVADLHFAKEDIEILRNVNPPPIDQLETRKDGSTSGSNSAETYDWSSALRELEERIQAKTMNEIFGPLLGPNLTQRIATFLRERTSDSRGRKPAERTARTYAKRIIERWRHAENDFKR